MPVPQQILNLPAFFAALRRAPQRVLFLDYDGTLAPFCTDPAQAVPYPGVPEVLDAIMAGGHTRLIIVSGRWTKDLLPLLRLKRQPEIFGSHGFEQLKPNGEYAVHPMDESALRALAEADTWRRDIEALGGRCEEKPGCLAIHWRGLPSHNAAQLRERVRERWQWMRHTRTRELDWHEFDGGIELRVPGRNKGDVVNAILGEMPCGTAAAYLGDDRTDEDAFEALAGRGLAVLVRPEYRPTAAHAWIRPPGELLEFLEHWQAACGGRR